MLKQEAMLCANHWSGVFTDAFGVETYVAYDNITRRLLATTDPTLPVCPSPEVYPITEDELTRAEHRYMHRAS